MSREADADIVDALVVSIRLRQRSGYSTSRRRGDTRGSNQQEDRPGGRSVQRSRRKLPSHEFAGGVAREFVDEDDVARDLVAGEM